VEKFVAVVICLACAVPAGAFATAARQDLLHSAARLSGLTARRPVPLTTMPGKRYDALLARALTREYPRTLQRADARVYALFGLTDRSTHAHSLPRAWYDPAARKLLVKRAPRPGRRDVVHELVRALVDQNFGLRRLRGLRARDRDRALAAHAIVDGVAALASRLRTRPLRGTAIDRFLRLEHEAGLGPGRALAAELRYLGGRRAMMSALRAFPRTTEQLLHVDKFLERERALAVRAPARAGDAHLTSSETFGELHVRNLLRAFSVPTATPAAAGWGGGRLALYRTTGGADVAVLILRWDTPEDAAEWRGAVDRYVASAFAGAVAHDCPPLDRCWSGTAEVAAGVLGTRSVLASGPGASALAAGLVRG
jgi:hypothetical protein